MTIRKRGDVWEYRFYISTDGKRKQYSKSGFRTKKECEIEGLKALSYFENGGTETKFDDMSLNALLDLWLSVASANLKATTKETYQKAIKNKIAPELGQFRVRSITPLKMQEFINKVYKENSPQYAKLIKIILSSAFKYAVVPLGVLQSSPCEYVKIPRTQPTIKPKVVSTEIVKKSLSNMPEPYSVAVLVSFYTGMRIGEVFALSWDDIDTVKKTININKTMSFTAHSWFITTPKTKTSIREIPIPEILVRYLENYKANQLSNKLKYGEYYIENYLDNEEVNTQQGELLDLVFREENGTFAKPNMMQYYTRKNGFHFHSLRHTHATTLIESGISPKIVSERLGHSNISITLQIYVHPDDKSHREAAETFEKIVL